MQTIQVGLSEDLLGQLALKDYDKAYTNIPNNKLPQSLQNQLAVVYAALTGGESLPETDSTFTVKADEETHKFSFAFGPRLCRNNQGLAIRWGKQFISLDPESKAFNLGFTPSGQEYKKFRPVDANISVGSDDTVYVLTARVYQNSLENPQDANTLNIVYQNNPGTLFNLVGEFVAQDGEGIKFGNKIKASQLPIGEYQVVKIPAIKKFKSEETETFFQLALTPEQTFTATCPIPAEKDSSGKVTKWGTTEKVCDGTVLVKPNTDMKRFIQRGLEVSSDKPATLHVINHYTTGSGHPAAKVLVVPFTNLSEVEKIDLSF